MKALSAIVLAALTTAASAASPFDHLGYSQSGCEPPALKPVSNEEAAQRTEAAYRSWQACYKRFADRLNAELVNNKEFPVELFVAFSEEAQAAVAGVEKQHADWVALSRQMAELELAQFAVMEARRATEARRRELAWESRSRPVISAKPR
ncbi:hypothetical protein [Massilia endophytica]|uniref:hypothetical protein n=1 Tax=Massilia endophytica TaxID=2899220 RepID=UPI001E50020A|nr:hypothetical protein [Massilia endophytica]UGQ45023.1 hypothetical protein LSQ66_14600 [Massilia endophytica]